jgi:uracil-DNA glycosylase
MQIDVKIEPGWATILEGFLEQTKFENLIKFIKSEYLTKTIYPKPENIFRAFWLTPFSKVKVIILGQDPYHGPNQAHGLSFSVPFGTKLPPSLKNIYKEIQSEFGITKDYSNGNLDSWANQGVLLLNSILTVAANLPSSHKNKGWEEFTDHAIAQLSKNKTNLVFLLWGNFAKSKKSLIDTNKHLVLEAPHPSPFSAYTGFFNCQHFLLCNQYLKKNGLEAISW